MRTTQCVDGQAQEKGLIIIKWYRRNTKNISPVRSLGGSDQKDDFPADLGNEIKKVNRRQQGWGWRRL